MREAMPAFIRCLEVERSRQDKKWGEQTHSGHTWVSILTEEVGEFAAAVNEGRCQDALEELVQVAAVACAAWEQSIRGDGHLLPTFGKCKQVPTPKRVTP